MTITTPSGHKVEFKDKLTYGDRRAIKSIMLEEMKVDLSTVNKDNPENSKMSEVSLAFTMKMEEEVFRRAIQSITLASGQKATGDLLDVVYSWDDVDGEAVFEHLKTGFDPEGVVPEAEKKTEN